MRWFWWVTGAAAGVVIANGLGPIADRSWATGQLVDAPTMSIGRAAHTATPLANRRVLVVGGFVEKGSAKGAELYVPERAGFTALPPMVTTRHSHTATLLPSGKVLVVGGYGDGSSTLLSAELFDPATNTFVATGSLLNARAGHVAMLLKNGKVLIAGGVGPNWTFLTSAELYDPATGRFSATGAMHTARESHVAVELQDGRVLIVGGHHGPRRNLTIHASTELYDAARGVFTRGASMQVRRHKHDAVLLPNGQVLVTGGADERDDRGVYNSTELFDPRTARFTSGPTMQRGRYKHAGSSVVLPSGVVLIAGGAAEAETYDPSQQRFTLVPGNPRMAGQFSAVAALADGRALITGGYGSGTGPRAATWMYQP